MCSESTFWIFSVTFLIFLLTLYYNSRNSEGGILQEGSIVLFLKKSKHVCVEFAGGGGIITLNHTMLVKKIIALCANDNKYIYKRTKTLFFFRAQRRAKNKVVITTILLENTVRTL